MARTRQIKPHFLYSASMRKVSVGAQLTFVRLWLLADDAGRVQDFDRPTDLAQDLYPGQPEPQTEVAGWLDELERVDCIVRYRVSDQPYLRIVNWSKHQKISKPTPSKRPGEWAAAREALESASGMAREPIANKAAEGASGLERTAVLANSRTALDFHERFAKTGAESAADGDSRRFHERLTRTLAFLHNRG